MKTKTSEFENFDRTMRQLVKIPHSEIKAKLDAEKAAKVNKQKQQKTTRKREAN